MKQRLIAAAALLALGAAHAQTDVRLSGFVDLSLEFLKNSGSNDTQKRITSGGLNNSRFNISGTEDLGAGNKAYFTIEPMFSADTGVLSTQFRQSFVGLRGNWGNLSLGRQFTPSFWIAGYADPNWASMYSMVNSMVFFYAPYRVDNSVQYNTPTVGGFTGRFMYSFGKEDTTKNGRFVSAGVDYRSGPLFIGFVQEHNKTANLANTAQIKSSTDNYLSAVYRMDGGIEPTFIFHTYKGYYAFPPYVGFDSKGWDVQLGVRWKLNPANQVHASFVHRNDDNNQAIGTANGLTMGFTHSLSKRTDLYVLASHVQNKKGVANAYPVTWQANPKSGQNPTGVAFGIRHGF